eukprot:7096407-Pyramimonas_sp.AAC.1
MPRASGRRRFRRLRMSSSFGFVSCSSRSMRRPTQSSFLFRWDALLMGNLGPFAIGLNEESAYARSARHSKE